MTREAHVRKRKRGWLLAIAGLVGVAATIAWVAPKLLDRGPGAEEQLQRAAAFEAEGQLDEAARHYSEALRLGLEKP